MRAISGLLTTLLLAPLALFAQDEGRFYRGNGAYTLAPRIALIIGVSSVNDSGVFQSLPNPSNDAAEIARALRNLGFDVIAPHENYEPQQITRQVIKQSLYDFARLLQQAPETVGLVYFSGHGIELQGHNYLVPFDGFVRYDRDLKEELIPLSWFYDAFRHADNKLNLLFIDACRNFPDAWGNLPSFGTVFKQDSKLPDNDKVILSYATLSGNTALDGKGRLSPYAAAFLESLRRPDAPLPGFFAHMAERVKKFSSKFQSPTLRSSGQNFVFFPTERSFNDEYHYYNIALRGKNRALLERVSQRYAHGYFGRFADEELKNTPKTPPPPAQFVRIIKRSALLERPMPYGDVIAYAENNERFGIYEELNLKDFLPYIPLYSREGEPVWIEKNATAAIPLVSRSYRMQYQPGTGSTESLATASRTQLQDALKSHTAIKRITVRATVYSGPDAATSSVIRTMKRQELVVQALADAGYKAADVKIEQTNTNDPAEGSLVELVITSESAGA